VIPVWNGRELLVRLLDSLSRQTFAITEVIAVDNGSTDGAPEAAAERGARVVRMGSNTGFARAVNCGIDECRTELVAVVNSDVELAPEWLARLAAAVDRPDVWFATGKLLQAGDPTRIDGTFDALCRGGTPWRIGHGRKDGSAFQTARAIRFASATATVYRADLFRRLGGFDSRFESYLEDVDLSLRAAAGGFRGAYVPDAVATHHGSATLGRWHPGSVRRMARNQMWLLAKHYPPGLRRRWLWPILVAHALWGLIALRHGTGLAYLRGKWEGWRSFATFPAPSLDLTSLVEESEADIRGVQRQTGFDWYWRIYFLLTSSEAD
jgi:GT2 family glycosyltransferase